MSQELGKALLGLTRKHFLDHKQVEQGDARDTRAQEPLQQQQNRHGEESIRQQQQQTPQR